MRPIDLDELTRAEKIVAGTGIVLVVDLLFLPWHSIDAGGISFAWTAVEHDHALLGVVALLLTAAAVAVTSVRALAPDTGLPDLPIGWDRVVFGVAVAALTVLVVKLVLVTDHLGVGAWLALVLAGGMAYGGATLRNRGASRNC